MAFWRFPDDYLKLQVEQRLGDVRSCLVQVIVTRTSVIEPCEEGADSKAISSIERNICSLGDHNCFKLSHF
jgi:hypothetical protein